ncbi:MAG: ammonium transporter [Bacteroidetes bacterium]|nr:ammonium transporter [Bacteroidota bacterium]
MNLSAIKTRRGEFFARMSENMAKPKNWKLGFAIFAGKIIGLFIALLAMMILPGILGTPAMAAETYTPHETSVINSINTIWTLVAAALVFGMQAGFVMLEAGFARKKETVNILVECALDTAICGISFWAIGYAFMFSHGNGFIGYHWFFLQGIPATYEATGVAVLAHWIFQFAFADTASTITSGAMIGRTSFRGDIIYSIFVTAFIYPIIGHWAWGPDGFLALMGTPGHFLPTLGQGFRDFAGSSVVHTIGGMVSLAGAVVLGPRIGRVFLRDNKEKGGLPAAHSLPLATIGAFLLWFGWYGFNPGSTLSGMDIQGIGRVAANTTLAACTGSLAAMLCALWLGPFKGKFDTGFTLNGMLAGLVAITAPCYWVSPLGSVILGAIAGVIVFGGVYLLEYLRIDDPVGAVSVHGFAGIWGTLSLGLFASGEYGATGPMGADNSAPVKGLFYGGGFDVLKAQAIGSFTITIATLIVSFIVMYAVMKLPYPFKLRVEPEGEIGHGGIDVWEHGAEAYHD